MNRLFLGCALAASTFAVGCGSSGSDDSTAAGPGGSSNAGGSNAGGNGASGGTSGGGAGHGGINGKGGGGGSPKGGAGGSTGVGGSAGPGGTSGKSGSGGVNGGGMSSAGTGGGSSGGSAEGGAGGGTAGSGAGGESPVGMGGGAGTGGSSGGPVSYTCAQSIHVATTGADGNDGSEAMPLETISVATKLADAGDCVLVHAGTYPEVAPITFVHDGTPTAPIVLVAADGAGTAIIDASGNKTDPMIIVANDAIIIDGFDIQNMPTDTGNQPIHFDGLLQHKGAGSVVRQCRITGGHDQLKVNQAAAGILVEGCEFYGAFGHIGISITGVVGMTLRANYFHDWASDGNGSIQIKGGSSNVVVDGNFFAHITGDSGAVALGDGCDATCDIDPEHYAAVSCAVINNVMLDVPRAVDFGGCKDCSALGNTVVGSATASVAYKLVPATTNGSTQECTGTRIENNILYSQTAALADVIQINSASGAGLVMDYNLYWNGGGAVSYGDTHPMTADVNSLMADPMFANASGMSPADFHLQMGSPAIDHGTTVDDAHDLDGTARPQGAGYDIGAFER